MRIFITILFIITIVEGGFIFHLYKKPQIIVKAVYENTIDEEFANLPTVPKETIKGLK